MQCDSLTDRGVRCKNRCVDGTTMCGVHRAARARREAAAAAAAADREQRRCTGRNQTGTRCKRKCALGDTMCGLHRRARILREEQDAEAWEQDAEVNAMHWRAFLPGPAPVVEAALVEAVPRIGEVGRIALDRQGVHTVAAVKQTTEIAEKIRAAVVVPDGYRWDPVVCSKTPGEIIAECGLSVRAAMQMMQQYSLDTAIYNIEAGIYGKVLDSVWQFVKGHAEKESLVSIICTEMEDNVGMCAQGNLTRICNIVAGYMDGVGSQESVSEILGRLLPKLMEVEDAADRIRRAKDILRENHVPEAEWAAWVEPLGE